MYYINIFLINFLEFFIYVYYYVSEEPETVFVWVLMFFLILYIRVFFINANLNEYGEFKTVFYRIRFYAFIKLYIIFPLTIPFIIYLRDNLYFYNYRILILLFVFLLFKYFVYKYITRKKRYIIENNIKKCRFIRDLKDFSYYYPLKNLKKQRKAIAKKHIYKMILLWMFKTRIARVLDFLGNSYFLYKITFFWNNYDMTKSIFIKEIKIDNFYILKWLDFLKNSLHLYINFYYIFFLFLSIIMIIFVIIGFFLRNHENYYIYHRISFITIFLYILFAFFLIFCLKNYNMSIYIDMLIEEQNRKVFVFTPHLHIMVIWILNMLRHEILQMWRCFINHYGGFDESNADRLGKWYYRGKKVNNFINTVYLTILILYIITLFSTCFFS